MNEKIIMELKYLYKNQYIKYIGLYEFKNV